MRFRYFLALTTMVGYLLYISNLKPAKKKNKREEEEKEEEEIVAIEKELVSYTAGTCRGRCKVFDLKIFDSGKVKLNSIKNLGAAGLHTFNISEEEVQKLLSIIEAESFSSTKAKYLAKDSKGSQQFEITIDGKSTIFHKKKAPKKLMTIKTALDKLVNDLI